LPNINGLVTNNMKLVISIARKYGDAEDLDDLVQEGAIGLFTAAKRYDPKKGSFSTIATWWVKKYVREAYMKNKLVSIPFNVQLKRYKESKLNSKCYAKYGIPIKCNTFGIGFLEKNLFASDNKYAEIEDKIDETRKLVMLYKEFYKLSDREKRIISIYCAGGGPKDGAKEFGVSRQRIQQIYVKAIEKLRKELINA